MHHLLPFYGPESLAFKTIEKCFLKQKCFRNWALSFNLCKEYRLDVLSLLTCNPICQINFMPAFCRAAMSSPEIHSILALKKYVAFDHGKYVQIFQKKLSF